MSIVLYSAADMSYGLDMRTTAQASKTLDMNWTHADDFVMAYRALGYLDARDEPFLLCESTEAWAARASVDGAITWPRPSSWSRQDSPYPADENL